MFKNTGLALFGLMMVVQVSLADDGAMNDGANGIEPLNISKGMESKIRMEKEHLRFEFGKDETKVTATFWFKNTDPTQAVTQLSGFPDDSLRPENEQHNSAPLEDLRTFVQGTPVPSPVKKTYVSETKEGYWVPSNPKDGFLVGWHTLRLVIPPGGETTVERRYHVANRGSNEGIRAFTYIVFTGATWHGTIGELTADVQLDDGIKVSDLIWPHFEYEGEAWEATLPHHVQWQVLDDHHMKLVWPNFKPKDEKDKQEIEIAWIGPDANNEKFQSHPYEHRETLSQEDCELKTKGDCLVLEGYVLIDPGMVQKAAGGRPLKEVLKPGTVVEYSGTAFLPGAIRVADPKTDYFRILDKR